MSKEIQQIVDLTVVRVAGGGNAGGGRYFYSFTPDLLVSLVPGEITYRLGEASSDGLRIRTVIDSASDGQMGPPSISEDGQTAVVRNYLTKPELINVAVVVVDLEHDDVFVKCDPQVLNIPE